MKLLDDDKLWKTIDRYIKNIHDLEPYFIKFGPVEVELPKKFLYRFLEKQKCWEADDINDVKDNYSLINTVSDIMNGKEKADFREYMKRSIRIKTFKDAWKFFKAAKKMNRSLKQSNLEMGIVDDGSDKSNCNIVTLDNIYLGDYNIKETSQYTCCDLTIKDRFNNTIPGIVMYNQKFLHQAGSLEEDLAMASSHADYSMAFDISFNALPVGVTISKFYGLYKQKVNPEPKLRILSIHKTSGNKKDFFPIDIRRFMPQYS